MDCQDKSKDELIIVLQELIKNYDSLKNSHDLLVLDCKKKDAILAGEEHYRNAFENLAVGIWFVDITGKFISGNKAVQQLLGYSNEELIKLTFNDITHPDDLSLGSAYMVSLLANEIETASFEKRYIRKDGQIIYAITTVSLIKENKEPQFFVTQINDITVRKEIELKLKDSKEKYSKIFDRAPVLISLTDFKTGIYFDVNDYALSFSGFSREEVIGKKSTEIGWISPGNRELLVNTLIEKGRIDSLEMEFKTKGGATVYGLVNGEKIVFNNNAFFLTITTDITERKKIEHLLQEKNYEIETQNEELNQTNLELIIAKEKIEESEEQFKAIFDNSKEAIGISQKGISVMVNQAYLNMFGYKNQNEIIGNSLFNQISPKEHDNIRQYVANRNIDKDIPSIYETIGLRKNGEEFPFEMNIGSYNLNNQNFSVGIIRDITDRKKAERELISAKEKAEKSEINLKESQAIARLGGWELDIDTGVFTFTDNLLKLFHTNADELCGYQMTIDEYSTRFVHPEDAAMVEKETLKASETNNPDFSNYVEHRIKYHDGGIGYIGVKYFIKKDENGRTIKIFGVIQDITEKKQAEQELITAKEKAEEGERALIHTHDLMQYIIEHNRSAVAVHDKNFKYIYVSQKYLQDYKVNEKDIIGKHHYDVFPDLPQKWRDVHKKALAGEVSSAEDDPYYKDDGTVEWTRWECRPWYENDNFIGGFIVYTEVITQRKNMELELVAAKERAEESDRLKTAFLNNMSHELRTPMNAIMGFSELLIKNYNNKPKLEKFSQIISQRCNDLLDIVNDILDIAKIESGLLPVSIEKCNLNALFAELSLFFTEYQNRIGKQQIKFSIQAQCYPLNAFISTDKGKLKQIFINLISNAFKFTETGIIECGCKFDTNENLIFYVSDTGIGISADKQKIIFERFAQLEPGKDKLISGTGLGLSIVKGLVGLLGGEIFLESQPNNGSTFSFTIPYKAIIEEPNEPLVDEKPLEYKFSNNTILIVEDDLYNADYLKEILTEAGLNTLHTEFGKKAIKISISQPVDLVLMDIRLPDIDGFEATQQIRQHKPHLKIIAQTAYASHADKQKAFDAGCIDYISKPTKPDILLAMLNKHLTKS